MDDVRDYLKEVETLLRRDPLSTPSGVTLPDRAFGELQDGEHRDELVRILVAALDVPNGTTRKTAAFALGQIGDPKVIKVLEEHRNAERTQGNVEAIDAALAVLRAMPWLEGSSELERRKAVENAYSGRPLRFESSSQKVQEPIANAGSGCLSIVVVVVGAIGVAALTIAVFAFGR